MPSHLTAAFLEPWLSLFGVEDHELEGLLVARPR